MEREREGGMKFSLLSLSHPSLSIREEHTRTQSEEKRYTMSNHLDPFHRRESFHSSPLNHSSAVQQEKRRRLALDAQKQVSRVFTIFNIIYLTRSLSSTA